MYILSCDGKQTWLKCQSATQSGSAPELAVEPAGWATDCWDKKEPEAGNQFPI